MSASDSAKKIEDGVAAMVDSIDRNIIRPVQRDTYVNISKCYNSTTASSSEIDACVQRSSRLIQGLTSIINANISDFQHRLQRCVDSCEDESSDYIRDNYAKKQADQISYDVQEKCVSICCDKHVDKIPQLKQRIEKDLKEYLKQK